MGQLDKAEKMLADYNDVFADIVNVLLFDGEQVISRGSLQDTEASIRRMTASCMSRKEML